MITTKLLAEARRHLEEQHTFDTVLDTPLGKGLKLSIGNEYVTVRAAEPQPFIVNGIRIRGEISFSLPDFNPLFSYTHLVRCTSDSKGKDEITTSARTKIADTLKSALKTYSEKNPEHLAFGRRAKLQGQLDQKLAMIQQREKEIQDLRKEADALRRELAL